DIYNYGVLLNEALDAVETPHPKLRRIAARCVNPDPAKRFPTLNSLRLAFADKRERVLYICIIVFLLAMIALLLWLNSSLRPVPTV
ncbi:MAG: hypothetical protein K2H88_03445, partial [Duncaniella sp.]|nr:hypothetical protein [Duncaniella sp.]